MSNNTKIYSEAIAEAKSIRETAMANAKLALEEAFAPRMQEMMSNKLEALAEEMEEDQVNETADNDADDTMSEEISLEELIAELDSLEETADNDADDSMNENTLEEAEDEDAVGEITVDELKDIIKDVMAGLMGGEEEGPEEEGEEEAGEEEEAPEGDEELSLDEILAELDSLNENEELDEYGATTMKEPSDAGAAGAEAVSKMVKSLAAKTGKSYEAISQFLYGGKKASPAEFEEGVELDENTELEEGVMDSVKDLAAKAGMSLDKFIDSVGQKLHGGKGLGTGTMTQNEDLQEALKTITVLRSSLNEVNLLNAKLLYVNKLFKGKNLTEAQKVKVINAFDRAETVKETKNIFETLKESFTTTKNPIKESLSFASKAAGVAPNRQPIVEGDEFMKRMQKIAGII